MWKVYVPSCVCVTYIRPHLLEKDTVFAWVAMQKSIYVIHEVQEQSFVNLWTCMCRGTRKCSDALRFLFEIRIHVLAVFVTN